MTSSKVFARREIQKQSSQYSASTLIHNDLSDAYKFWNYYYVSKHLHELFACEDTIGFYAKALIDYAGGKNIDLKILSIGCGDCNTEIQVCKLLKDFGISKVSFTCVDVAEGALETGRSASLAAGVEKQFVIKHGEFEPELMQTWDVVMAT